MTVLEAIRSSVEEILAVEPDHLSPETHIVRDLDADSLEMVELVMALEEKLAIEIPDEDAFRQVTVADWIEYLSRRIATKEEGEASKV